MLKKYSLSFVLLVFAALHLWLATRFELGVDEAHYVLYGLRLDWSYFDHPPLVGWTQSLFVHWPLGLMLKSRLPAILASFIGSWLIAQFLRRKKYDDFEVLTSIIGLNLSLLFLCLSLFHLPDTLLIVLTPALLLAVDNLEENKSFKSWLLLGLLLGLSGLSKYTAGLFLVPLVVYWIGKKWLQDLVDFKAWFAVILSLLLLTPILYWNYQNGGVSFKYQSGHLFSLSNFDVKLGLAAELSQWIGWGFFMPWIFFWLKKDFFRFEKLLVLSVWGLFGTLAFFGNFLPHWMAAAFVVATPLAIAENLKQKKYFTKSLKIAFACASLLFVFIHLELGFQILPKELTRLIYRDIQGWQSFSQRLDTRAQENKLEIAVTNWTFGSRISLYSNIRKPIFVLDQRFDQFDLWNSKSSQRANLLVMVETEKSAEFWQNNTCQEKILLSEDGPEFRGDRLVNFEIWKCTGFISKADQNAESK